MQDAEVTFEKGEESWEKIVVNESHVDEPCSLSFQRLIDSTDRRNRLRTNQRKAKGQVYIRTMNSANILIFASPLLGLIKI